MGAETVLAVLYDIHGNLRALEAVLEDARARRADRFLLGGDYALFGPSPEDTVAALRTLSATTWIRGNVDRWTATPDDAPADEILRGAIDDYREALGETLALELGALPSEAVLDDTRYCHASPISDVHSFMPEPSDDDDRLLGGAQEPRVVFGHTHLQFRRSGPRGVELVNPGSVGLPLDGDRRAAYMLLSEDGKLEQRRVDYDVVPAVEALRNRFAGRAWAERSVVRLERAGLA